MMTPVLIISNQPQALADALTDIDNPLVELDATMDVANIATSLSAYTPVVAIIDDPATCAQYREYISGTIVCVAPTEQIEDALNAGADECIPLNKALIRKRVLSLIETHTFSAYDNLQVMVQALDDAHKIRYVNAHWLEVLGYSWDEVIGKSILNFMTETSKKVAPRFLSKIKAGEIVSDLALRFVHKDGSQHDILINANNTHHGLYIAILQDITALKQAEQDARSSQTSLQSIVNALTDSIFVMNRDGSYAQVVSEGDIVFPLDVRELIGENIRDYLPPERTKRLLKLIEKTIATGKAHYLEYERSEKDPPDWRSLIVSPYKHNQVVTVIRDITHTKLAEKSVVQSEMRYRGLFENATDAIFIIDAESHLITEANPQASRMLGYATDELAGMPISNIDMTPGGHLLEREASIIQTRRLAHETQYRRHNGDIIDVEVSSRFIVQGNDIILVSFVRNTTERKQHLAEIQRQRKLASALLETANALNGSHSLTELFDLVLSHLSRIIDIESANVMLIEDGIAKIVSQIGYKDAGFDPQEIQQISIPLSEASNLAWVHTNKRPLCINDTQADANFQFRENTTEDYVKSLLNAPLIVDGEVIGIMNLDSNEVNRFTQEDEDHLMAFTNQLAIAIQQARFIEQLQDNADKLEQRVQERTAELHLVNDDLRQQIVQRKLAETERQREQALLRTLIDNLPDNIYVKDTEQRYLVANNAIMTTLLNGKTHDEIVGKTNRQLFGDLDWVAERAIQDAQLLESGEAIVEQEYKTQHTTNPTDWYLITKIPLRDNKGKIIGFVGINRDISQLKRIQLQLAEERNLLRTVIDTIPDNIYVKDTEQRFMMVNRTLHQFLFQDYDMQEIIGKSNRDLFGEDAWVSEREQADNHLLTSGTPIYEQEYQIPETNMGIERGWFLLTKVPLRDANGDIYAYLGINRDLTTLKKVQQQLSDERNLLRTIIDTIPDQIYVKDNEGKFLIANRATIEHAAHVETEADLIGKDDYALHPSIADETHTEEQALIDETLPAIRRLDTFLGDNGTTQHLMVNKLPLRNADGTITGVVGINHDLTALKQAEAQLKQVLHSARCLLWSAIVSYDAQTETYTWDYQIANIEAAQSFLPLMHNDDTLSYEARWLAAIPQDQQAHRETTFADHAKQGQDAYTLEFHLYADDAQTKVWLNEDVLIESQDNDLWHVVGVCTDITTRKHAEQQLQLINEELEQRVEERTEELTEALNIQMQEIVERLQAVERERQQRMRAEALRDSVAMLNSNLNRDAIFDQLLLTLRDVIPHDASNVMLIENGVATVVRASGYEHQILDFSYKVDDFEDLRTVYETREAFIIPDIHTYEPWRDITTFGWVHSNLTVPIISHDEVIGFMNLDHHKVNFFTQEHANWLMSFGDQAGIAIRNARYTEELEQRVQERTQELEFEQSQLKAILDAMNDGVIYTDNDRQPQYINQSLVDIAGYTSEEWLNGTAQANINTRDTEYVHNRWQETLRTLDKRDFWDLEVRLRHKDGNEFDAHIGRTVVHNIKGERVGIVTVLRDISDEKRLREQKARFIATAAHELRTPIANIKTRLFLMRRKPERFMEHIEIAESVTNLMQNLVEHMFDITRFERGIMTLSYEKVTLSQLLSEIIQYQAPEAERLDISTKLILPENSIKIEADAFRLTQVITNLLGNALKYTKAGTNIVLEVKCEDKNVQIDITDNGDGIEKEHLQHLFQPFYRISDTSKGAGLGLAIAQEIIHAHHGEITVNSEIGVGTTFSIILPITQPDTTKESDTETEMT